MNRKDRRAAKSDGSSQSVLKPLVAQALRHHQAGQLAAAEGLYRQHLAANGRDADALYLLGVLCAQKGAFDEALHLLSLAVQLRPNFADAWFNLGTLHVNLKNAPAAEAALRQCLKHKSDHAGALWNLGNLLLDRRIYDEAEKLIRAFLRLQRGNFEADCALVACLSGQNRFNEAIKAAREVLAKRHDKKVAALLGQALFMQSKLEEAEPYLRDAARDFPHEAAYRTTLATLLSRYGDIIEANTLFQELLAQFPSDPYVLFNYGLLLAQMGRLEEGLAYVERADAIKPDDSRIQTSLGMVQMQMGRLADGWKNYYRRFEIVLAAGVNKDIKSPPLGPNDRLDDHAVLLWPEQGIGDQITFSSALPEMIAQAKGVEVLSAPKLASLFSRSFPNARIITNAKESRATRSMSMGHLFERYRTDLSAFAEQGPYLRPDAQQVAKFKSRLEALGPGLKVGIGWRSTSYNKERGKFFFPSLLPWKDILQVEGVVFVNLQPKVLTEELEEARRTFGCRIEIFDDVDLFDGLDDTAALMSALDVAITNGSANAFLAAAVGAPVWMFHVADAHWDFLGSDHVPWLPSLIPVQRRWHEGWDNAIARIAQALRQSASSGHLIAPVSASSLPIMPTPSS